MSQSLVSLAALVDVARMAGARVMHWYKNEELRAESKIDESPVTQADLAAHVLLGAELPRLLPGVPIVSEEGGVEAATSIRLVQDESCFWLVDPLDGTRDFLSRTGDFSVNIALMIDGRPSIGCVLAPTRGVCYVAGRNEGAFMQKAPGTPLLPIRSRAADQEHFTCLVSRSHLHGEDRRLLAGYPHATVKRVGSALKYVEIAAGAADVSVRNSPTSLWDTAAAQCVLETAGGKMLDFKGEPLRYRTGTLINPPFVAFGDANFPWSEFLKKLSL